MSSLSPSPTEDPRRDRRTTFRVLGFVILLAGLGFIGAAGYDLVTRTGFEQPTKFWMFFVGVPLLFVGGVLLQLGFAGAAASYLAGEYSPAMRQAGQAFGVRGHGHGHGHGDGSGPYCGSCGKRCDAAARFCDGCGTSMAG